MQFRQAAHAPAGRDSGETLYLAFAVLREAWLETAGLEMSGYFW